MDTLSDTIQKGIPEPQHPTHQSLNPLGFHIMAMAADIADPPGVRGNPRAKDPLNPEP